MLSSLSAVSGSYKWSDGPATKNLWWASYQRNQDVWHLRHEHKHRWPWNALLSVEEVAKVLPLSEGKGAEKDLPSGLLQLVFSIPLHRASVTQRQPEKQSVIRQGLSSGHWHRAFFYSLSFNSEKKQNRRAVWLTKNSPKETVLG